MQQNFKNHIRFNPAFHFFAVPANFTAFCFAIYAFSKQQDLTHGLIVFAFVMLGITLVFSRFFALKVQDRAARAEEKLRYFILTGKPLPASLKLGQILALRFASDEEFEGLVHRAVNEKLTPKEIKKAVKQWRGDYHRV